MIAEISAMIIYVIWMWVFYYRATTRIDKLECEKRELEKRVSELEKTVYIVPRMDDDGH